MNSETRSRACLVLIALFVAAATLWATAPYGPGASPDAASYVATARSLLEGRGFTTFGPHPYTAWPPLVPLELALLGLARIDPLEGSRWINAGASGLIVWLAGRTALEEIESRALAWLSIAALAVLPAARIVSVFAWSEPTFTVFLLLTSRALARRIASVRERQLWIAGFCAAAACLTRYVGVVAVIAGAWSIAATSDLRALQRVRHLALYVAIAAIPLAVWIVRNALLDAHPLGDRYMVAVDVAEIAGGLGRAIYEGFFGVGSPPTTTDFVYGVLGVALIVASALRARTTTIGEGMRMAAVYVVLVSALACGVGFDGWNRRLLAPIAPFLLLGTVRALESWSTRRRSLRVAVSFIVATCVVGMTSTSISVFERARVGRLPYQARAGAQLEIVRWLREHTLEGLVFANDPAMLALFARRDAYVLPSLLDAPGNAQARDAVERAPAETPRWLVWIGDPISPFLEHELSLDARREVVARLADGVVFRVR